MSRARQTLQLFAVDGICNPHVAGFEGVFLQRRRLQPDCSNWISGFRHVLLGLEDMFMDFAGISKENSTRRKALARSNCGDIVGLELRSGQCELVDKDGISIARLSRKAKAEWQGRLHMVEKARIVAMVRRYLDDTGDEDFRKRCYGSVWEVPMVELCLRMS